MSKIKFIKAREILDSRGEPTIEVEVILNDDTFGVAKVPSGASTGKFEALELRDGDPKKYNGKGVLKACENVNTEIASKLKRKEITEQGKIDDLLIKLDGTENKSRLGANAILGVSLACAYAAARSLNLQLYEYIGKVFGLPSNGFKIPRVFMNVINGGKHADSGLDIQEYMIVPQAESLKEKIRTGSEVFHKLKEILHKENYSVGVGDEGGFAPKLENNVRPIEIIMKAIEEAGYQPGKDVNLAVDAAASSFCKENNYVLALEGTSLSSDRLISMYADWVSRFPVVALEDGLAEEDWDGWAEMTKRLGSKIQVIGDDLLVTNVKRLKKCIKRKAANSILIKPNQIGTLTETLDCIKLAKKAGFNTMISHRSGETTDTFIADLVVGTAGGQIKTGSLSRGERVCKYNRLMRIEEELGIV